jgi:hypothetical protein
VAVEHLGTKATVDAAGSPAPAGARDLNAWHGDSFVNGPAWPEFARAMGLDDPAKSGGSVGTCLVKGDGNGPAGGQVYVTYLPGCRVAA